MKMTDDEVDYMSDAFITASENKDIRPGLIHDRSLKRSHELDKKKHAESSVKKIKPLKVLEEEKRSDALNKPLSAENKGFSMMAKMGFSPGAGLGKHGQGRAEPVGIEIKVDKQGLGRAAAIREIMERKEKILMDRLANGPSVKDFLAGVISRDKERKIGMDLRKSQRVCSTLDQNEGLEEPEEAWFWPKPAEEEKEDEEDLETEVEPEESDLTDEEKLELLTLYLRQTYFYCIWCGVQYDNDEDLKNCPGKTRDDH